VVVGTIVRDSIVPYATARKIGWTDVDFLGAASSYDLVVAAAQGGVTEGFYAMGLTDMPYRDTLSPPPRPGSIATRTSTRSSRISARSTARSPPISP
jgi:hypothetical protein